MPFARSPFYNQPPFFRTHTDLIVDITPLILYDRIIINKSWVDLFGKELWGLLFHYSSLIYNDIKELIKSGIIELRDYASDTRNNLSLLKKITDNDLADLSLWIDALKQSALRWQEYAQNRRLIPKSEPTINLNHLYGQFFHYTTHGGLVEELDFELSVNNLSTDALRELILNYLLNVNNNLLLSREYTAGFFDWFDYEPFYTRKLMRSIGLFSDTSTILQAGTLLSYYLPLEQITSVRRLLQVRDKAKGLREYLEAKQQGDTGADEKTLVKILLEIERAQGKIASYQKIASYFTLPISLIPSVGPFIGKVVEDVADWQIKRKFLKDYKWHFSLLEFAENVSSNHDRNTRFRRLSRNFRTLWPIQQSEHVEDSLLKKVEVSEFPDFSELSMTNAGNSFRQEDQYLSTDTSSKLGDVQQCRATTKIGKRCRNYARPGSKFCRVHSSQIK